mmetsp:Transcript_16969/g.22224  ORF Transcript_16969/g.22224 Transcript_16969/m.22224 type:complete len:120 (-) Transcript_16969:2056-2415(-)
MKEKAEQYLDEKVVSHELVDLHTHLLGMGSADWWVTRIMKVYLPRVFEKTKKNRKFKDGQTNSKIVAVEVLAKDLKTRRLLPSFAAEETSKGLEIDQSSQTKREKEWKRILLEKTFPKK